MRWARALLNKLLTLLAVGAIFAAVGGLAGVLLDGLSGLAWGAGVGAGLFVGADRGAGSGIPDVTGDRHDQRFRGRGGFGR